MRYRVVETGSRSADLLIEGAHDGRVPGPVMVTPEDVAEQEAGGLQLDRPPPVPVVARPTGRLVRQQRPPGELVSHMFFTYVLSVPPVAAPTVSSKMSNPPLVPTLFFSNMFPRAPVTKMPLPPMLSMLFFFLLAALLFLDFGTS